MNILVVTTGWPRFPGDNRGIWIERQVRILRQLGHTIEVFHFRPKKNPLRYLKASLVLRSKVRTEHDLIHAHFGNAGFISILAAKGKIVIVTLHGSDVFGERSSSGRMTLQGHIRQTVTRWTVKRADRVILVAERMKKELPPRDFDVIPMGISTTLFRPMDQHKCRNEIGLDQSVPLVLFVGSPEKKEKRYELACSACEMLRRRLRCDLVLADGVDNEKIPLYMGACDVLLITSMSEGSPTVVKEAICCGLPIVSVDVGDVKERIKDIAECEVVSSDTPEVLANALERVLKTRRRILIEGERSAMDENVLTNKVLQLYADVTESHTHFQNS